MTGIPWKALLAVALIGGCLKNDPWLLFPLALGYAVSGSRTDTPTEATR